MAVLGVPPCAWSQSTQAQVRVWMACFGYLGHANHRLQLRISPPQDLVARQGTPNRGFPARDARQQDLLAPDVPRVWLAALGHLQHPLASPDDADHLTLVLRRYFRRRRFRLVPDVAVQAEHRHAVTASNARPFTVFGSKIRRPTRPPSCSTEPLPCLNCVPELGQRVMSLCQLCTIARCAADITAHAANMIWSYLVARTRWVTPQGVGQTRAGEARTSENTIMVR